MSKTIFVAGATGAIGQPLSRMLIANGWKVYGSTRTEKKLSMLREIGAEPIVVDVFNAELLKKILADIRPEIVIHQLTDLPYALEESKMQDALVRNARL